MGPRSKKRKGGGRQVYTNDEGDFFSESEEDSEEEVDEEIGTGWTWFVKGRGGDLGFAGKPLPSGFIKKLGRTGGSHQLAGNMLRTQMGLVPALRERKRVRRYMDERSDDEDSMDSSSGEEEGDDDGGEDGGRAPRQERRRRHRGGRNGRDGPRRPQEKPRWMEGIKPNEVAGQSVEEDQTPAEIAELLNVDVRQLVYLGKEWYPSLHAQCRLLAGTVLQIPDTPGALPGNYPYPRDAADEMENPEYKKGDTWFQRRVVDKFSPVLSREDLRTLAVTGGVVSFRWADNAMKKAQTKRKNAALRREKALTTLEPALIDFYNAGASQGQAAASVTDTKKSRGPQLITFYSHRAEAKRKGKLVHEVAKSNKRQKKEKKQDDGKPKRPQNAYMLFCKTARAQVVTENPEVSSVGEISKLCGARWKALPAEERAPFEATAAELLATFRTELEAWKVLHPELVKPAKKSKFASAVAVPAPPSAKVDPDGWTIAHDETRNEQCVKTQPSPPTAVCFSHQPALPDVLRRVFLLTGIGGMRRHRFRPGRTRKRGCFRTGPHRQRVPRRT